jgi:hypothetical protein
MIKIASLTDRDLGRWVQYVSASGTHQRGRIKSWSKRFIHVVYYCDNRWDEYERFTAASTLPEDISFD